MLEISAFAPADVLELVPQQQQADEFASIGDWQSMVRWAAQSGPSWTGRLDGRVIGCAGFALRWKGRAGTWCILSAGIPSAAWLGIHRAVRRRMIEVQALGVWRVEAETMSGFVPGARWLELLGFEYEGLARGYGPGGQDFRRYARVML